MSRWFERRSVLGIGALLGVFAGFALLPVALSNPVFFYGGWFVAWAGLVLFAAGRSGGRDCREGQGSAGKKTSGRIDLGRFGFPAATRTRQILLVALLLRLLAICLPLSLSDDAYRYVWDGKVVAAGFDPYAFSPEAQELEFLRDDIWERTAHRDVETVYPPAAQGMFALVASFEKPLFAWRALLAAMDLLACWLLMRLLSGMRMNPRNVVLYAWNPLVVLEGVGMGHVDVAGTCLLVVALYCVWRAWGNGACPAPLGTPLRGAAGWSIGAGCALAGGVLLKVVPLVLVPLWLLTFRSWRLLMSFATTLLVGLLPIFLGVGVPPGLLRYGVSWEFNGALFEPLWRILAGVGAVGQVKSILSWLGGFGWQVERLLHYVYPQFLAKLMLASGLSAGVLVLAWYGRKFFVSRQLLGQSPGPSPPREPGRQWLRWNLYTLMLAMTFTATMYPWYLLWALPLAAAVRSWPVLLLSCSMAFAYLPHFGGVGYFPWVWALVWLPPAIFFVVNQWRRSHKPLEVDG